MNTYTTPILILLVLIISCASPQKDRGQKDYSIGTGFSESLIDDYELVSNTEINVSTKEAPHRFQRRNKDYLRNDSLLYYPYENNIVELNLENGYLKSMKIPSYEVKSDFSYIYPINSDSIIVIERLPPKVMILDRNGEVIYKQNLPFADFTIENTWMKGIFMAYSEDDHNYNLSLHRDIYFDTLRKELHIPILPVDYILSKNMENTETIGVYSLKERKWENLYGKARGLARFRGDKNYGHIYDRNYFLVRGDTTIISYPISHQIFLVNNKTDKLIAEFPAHPKNATKIPAPIDKSTLTNGVNRPKLKEWRNSCPFYDALNYHQDLEIYTRIYYESNKNPENIEDFYFKGRKQLMLIFDKDFNLISEIELDNDNFEFGKYLATNSGYMIAPSDYQNMVEESLNFQLGYKSFLDIVKSN